MGMMNCGEAFRNSSSFASVAFMHSPSWYCVVSRWHLSGIPGDRAVMREHPLRPRFVVPGWVEGGVEVADLLFVQAVEARDASLELGLHVFGLAFRHGTVFDADSFRPPSVAL